MKLAIGILQADDVYTELVDTHGEYPSMFKRLLESSTRHREIELTFTTYKVNRGIYPKDIHEVDAYIMTGSKNSVYENIPWIIELGEFVKTLHHQRKTFVGICFGHQMVAHALGGDARLASAGWSLGIKKATLDLSMHQNRFSASLAKRSFKLIYSHRDQVIEPAPGAVVLASTDGCPIAACSLEPHILTLQGHPEFSLEYAKDLFSLRRKVFPDVKFRLAMNSLCTSIDQRMLGEAIIDFCLSGLTCPSRADHRQ